MNIAHHLIRAGRIHGAKPAVARGANVVLSYEALADKVTRLASALTNRLELRAGDRVGLALKNCTEYPVLMYACWHAGLVAVPVNAKLHPSELAFIVENSGARVCFATADIAGEVANAIEDQAKLIEVGSDEYHTLASTDAVRCRRAPRTIRRGFFTPAAPPVDPKAPPLPTAIYSP